MPHRRRHANDAIVHQTNELTHLLLMYSNKQEMHEIIHKINNLAVEAVRIAISERTQEELPFSPGDRAISPPAV